MFVSFGGWTLILWKMVERKAFLAKPMHQYHVHQWGEQDCCVTNKKNGDYYNYPSLYHFMDELWF